MIKHFQYKYIDRSSLEANSLSAILGSPGLLLRSEKSL
jgi:hypothetical protein